MVWVWVVAVVLALVVLALVGYSLLGAVTRLRREVAGARADLQPVLASAREAAARAEARGPSVPAHLGNAG